MQPHSITPWYESVSAMLSKKVTVLEEYDEVVSSPSLTVNIPAVTVLKKMISRTKKDVKFSRINVYTRDGFSCQYCGEKKPIRSLTYDHVHPFSKGGKTVWENIVTACGRCNSKKDNKLLEDSGMKLLKRPVKPKTLPLSSALVLPAKVPALWLPYLEGQEGTIRSA
jgi:5-methylcytosine-specific restriction endonuclease McrA